MELKRLHRNILFQVEKSSGELVSNPDFIQKELENVVEYLTESVGSFSGTSLAAQNLNEKKKGKHIYRKWPNCH